MVAPDMVVLARTAEAALDIDIVAPVVVLDIGIVVPARMPVVAPDIGTAALARTAEVPAMDPVVALGTHVDR